MTRTSFPYLSDVLAEFGIHVPLHLPMFGLMVVTAFFLGLAALKRELRIRVARGELANDAEAKVSDIALTVLLLGIVGAKLFSLLETPELTWSNLPSLLFSGSGLTIYGGLILGGLGFAHLARKHQLPVLRVLDAAGPAYLLAYGIGRIGCQIVGDGDWGIPSDLAAKPDWLPMWLWSQHYVGNILNADLGPDGVYPAPLYETLMAVSSFVLLSLLPQHFRSRPGLMLGLTLFLVGAERELIESIRVNIPYHIAGYAITQAQLISVPMMLVGLVLVVRAVRRGIPASSSESVAASS